MQPITSICQWLVMHGYEVGCTLMLISGLLVATSCILSVRPKAKPQLTPRRAGSYTRGDYPV